MPTRLVRDTLLDSHRYALLSTEGKLLYIHLLLLADDFGCVSVSETFLRRRAFHDAPSGQKIAQLLGELSDADMVRCYEVDRGCFAFIPRFRQKLQRLNLKHPPPPTALIQDDKDAFEKFNRVQRFENGQEIPTFGKKWDDLRTQAFERDGYSCVRCGSQNDLHGHHINPVSRGGETTLSNLTTLCDKCNSWARNNIDKCNEIKEIIENRASGQMLARICVDTAQYSEEKRREEKRSKPLAQTSFALFWSAYPRKKSKGQAEKAFLKIKPNEQLLQTILFAIERAKTSADWMRENGTFIPYPATWLSARGWEDELIPTQYQPGRLAL